MSITLTPLPMPSGYMWPNEDKGTVRPMFSEPQLRAAQQEAVEADRASRVPMTDAQIETASDACGPWLELIRAVEAHHGIGAKPAPTLPCAKCGVDRAKAPCRMPFIATTLCPFTGTTS